MITVSVSLPPYLYQWAVNKFDASNIDGHTVVEPIKGSPVSQFLRNFLRHKKFKPDIPEPVIGQGAVPVATEVLYIKVPHFPGRDPQYYNYLPIVAEAQLRDLIRSRFDVDLYTEFSRFDNVTVKNNEFIYSWLESNGIEPNETNWLAVDKRLQLLRRKAIDRKRKNFS